MMVIHAYAAKEKKGLLAPMDYEPEPLKDNEIEVQITHCGVCHSDLHLLDGEWGDLKYPIVPGHEIVGTISKLGARVKGRKIGERVGIGWQCHSCRHCEWCEEGEENLCPTQGATCVGRFGGYADKIQVESHFAFPLPEALSSERAAPLLCGGATVFSPLLSWDIRPTDKVGIIGIGGLGHIALQFANAFGAEVTALSSSEDKKQEALRLGAHHFLSSKDPEALKKAASSFDFLLCTVSNSLPWDLYIKLLRPKGVLCFVGAVAEPVKLTIIDLITERKTVTASNIASPPVIKKMLDFAAKHKIGAEVEVFPIDQINVAMDRMRKGDLRYRAVLKLVK